MILNVLTKAYTLSCPFLCYTVRSNQPALQKTALKINPNVTQADSLENYLALSLTDYCLHAPLLPGHYGCVEALVTWGADVDMDIPHLGTALYTACVCQELECARKLLREGELAAQCGSLHLHTDRYTSCRNTFTHTSTVTVQKKRICTYTRL